MKMEKIFISYRRDASRWTAAFLHYVLLNTYGRKTFLDVEDLKGPWRDGVFEALKASTYFVLILARESFNGLDDNSVFLQEIKEALRFEKFIVPIFQEELDWTPFEPFLREFDILPLKNYQSFSLLYQNLGMVNCAESVNNFTTPQRDVPKIQLDSKKIETSINQLEEGEYKESVEHYYEEDTCELCQPENPFSNFIEWGYGKEIIEEGADLIEKIGYCNYCAGIQVKCAKCGSINGLVEGKDQTCFGCGVTYEVFYHAKDGQSYVSAFPSKDD
jgi:hypothetical protein